MELGIERLTKLLLDLDEEARLVFWMLGKEDAADNRGRQCIYLEPDNEETGNP